MTEEEKKSKKKKKRKRSHKSKRRKLDENGEDDDGEVSSEEKEIKQQQDDGVDEDGKKEQEVKADVDSNAEVEEMKDRDKNVGDEKNDEGGDDESKPKKKRKRKRKRKSAEIDEDENEQNMSSTDKERQKKINSMDHTVYVEGLPFDSTEEDVKEFFVSNGLSDILEMRFSRWQDSGRLRGFGHVVFDSLTSVKKAIEEVSGRKLGKRYVTIQPSKDRKRSDNMGPPRDQPDGCTVVFVKNLPYDATESDIKEAFQVCGKIVDGGVRIARNFQTRMSKGFGYVEYKNPEGAFSAVQKSSKGGMRVQGRCAYVDYDEGRIRGSYKTQDGRLWSKEHKN